MGCLQCWRDLKGHDAHRDHQQMSRRMLIEYSQLESVLIHCCHAGVNVGTDAGVWDKDGDWGSNLSILLVILYSLKVHLWEVIFSTNSGLHALDREIPDGPVEGRVRFSWKEFKMENWWWGRFNNHWDLIISGVLVSRSWWILKVHWILNGDEVLTRGPNSGAKGIEGDSGSEVGAEGALRSTGFFMAMTSRLVASSSRVKGVKGDLATFRSWLVVPSCRAEQTVRDPIEIHHHRGKRAWKHRSTRAQEGTEWRHEHTGRCGDGGTKVRCCYVYLTDTVAMNIKLYTYANRSNIHWTLIGDGILTSSLELHYRGCWEWFNGHWSLIGGLQLQCCGSWRSSIKSSLLMGLWSPSAYRILSLSLSEMWSISSICEYIRSVCQACGCTPTLA